MHSYYIAIWVEWIARTSKLIACRHLHIRQMTSPRVQLHLSITIINYDSGSESHIFALLKTSLDVILYQYVYELKPVACNFALILIRKMFFVLFLHWQAFWVIVLFARNVEYLYMARILAGFAGGGIYVCVPLFVAEIADQKWVLLALYQWTPISSTRID